MRNGLVACSLAGCSGVQSALAPAGPQAVAIDRLGWIMMTGGAAIFVAVCALTLWALIAPAPQRRWLGGSAAVIGGGIAFPVVTLTALLAYGLALAGGLARPPAEPPLNVAIIGERWWWRVHYLDGAGAPTIVTANEIRIPTGRPVAFTLTTADVIHSFWAPNLAGKRDMIPGRANRLVLEAERAGRYRGQCAEFCGAQHAHMAFDVVALEPAAFKRWLEAQARPAKAPAPGILTNGARIFRDNGCGACHTIRGTDAAGSIGPDLTHVGSRLSLAAGTLANNEGAFAAWVAHSQGIKPGNLMPSYEIIEGADLRALAAYLASLQ